jgi:uncharacterized membrane protein
MSKILVSTFESETAAFEGLSALKDLHRGGDITLYASSVVAKDAAGVVAIRQEADRGPVGTLVGLVTGGLVGLLGGPVGVAVGAYIGGFGGLLVDMFTAGMGMDFVDEVSAALTPGTAAVVADIDETWVTPVDTRLGALGGTTYRRYTGEVIDEQLVRETEASRAELERLRAELREAAAQAKANVQAAIERQQHKLEALVVRVDKELDRQNAEFEARLSTLQAQRAQAQEQQRQRIDARIAELKASHEARKAKLEEARRLAKQSAGLAKEALVP